VPKLLRLALAALLTTALHAAPIPVKSFTKDSDGITLCMKPGVLKLRVCDERIIRVVYTPTESLPQTKSFVITHEWKPVPFEVTEDANSVALSTGKLRVAMNRGTGAVIFLDSTDRTLLAEAADGGKTLTPMNVGPEQTYTVEQAFQSPADESLYGLGQFQDALWNWRGIPLELRQLNTQIAVPMLVSSKGYGLLWDNASLLDFNPADQQIPLDGSTATAPTGNQPKATEDLAKTPMDISKLGKKTGTFTTGEGVEYVFFAKNGDLRGDFAIIVNGKQVAGVTNVWTPYALSAKVMLPASSERRQSSEPRWVKPLTTHLSTGQSLTPSWPAIGMPPALHRSGQSGRMASGNVASVTQASSKFSTRQRHFAANKSPSMWLCRTGNTGACTDGEPTSGTMLTTRNRKR
jgi:hypothetical protein